MKYEFRLKIAGLEVEIAGKRSFVERVYEEVKAESERLLDRVLAKGVLPGRGPLPQPIIGEMAKLGTQACPAELPRPARRKTSHAGGRVPRLIQIGNTTDCISVAHAATRFGVSQFTVRMALKKGAGINGTPICWVDSSPKHRAREVDPPSDPSEGPRGIRTPRKDAESDSKAA